MRKSVFDNPYRQIITVRGGHKSSMEVLRSILHQHALKSKETIYSRSFGGHASLDEIYEVIKREGGHLLNESICENEDTDVLYIFENSILYASIFENTIEISIDSLSEEWIERVGGTLAKLIQSQPPQGQVMMLAHEGNFYLTPLGEIDCPFERGNYTEKITAEYDALVSDLKTTTPTGRLALLDGDPGTGKSYLIRGIISEVEALCVYVPATLTGTITGPDIIPVFLNERRKHLPIVLIMEDVDTAISTRQMDNMSRLSDLLNMSDGILGDMADIRIIATTNAKKTEIDPAVLRVGRLSQHFQFTALTDSQAISILSRLIGKELLYKDYFNKNTATLAEIYSVGRELGWKPKENRKRRRRRGNRPFHRFLSPSEGLPCI
jgi:hypothetical protein